MEKRQTCCTSSDIKYLHFIANIMPYHQELIIDNLIIEIYKNNRHDQLLKKISDNTRGKMSYGKNYWYIHS